MAITKISNSGVNGSKYDIVSADNYYMEPIATTLLASNTGTVTFSNIPQTYKHLQLRMLTKNAGANDYQAFTVYFNSDTGNNCSTHYLQGSGALTYAGGAANATIAYNYAVGANRANEIYNPTVLDLLDYTNTSKYKTVRSFNGWDYNGGGFVSFNSGCWLNTAAVTSIQITHPSNFTTYSRFSLYGIKG